MGSKKRKLYLDTSIFGFALNRYEPRRRAEANRLLRQIRAGLFVGGYSFVTQAEIDAAPENLAKKLRRKVAGAKLRRIRIRSRSQAHDLAQQYCQAGVIPQQYFDDALHVAVATLWRCDALVSYNFTHLVRLETMVGVNAVNRDQDLAEIFICQPSEVIVS